jgi:hypothetical protein
MNLVGDALDGLEISDGGDGKTGLDDVNAEALKLAGDDELFGGVHAATGRLLAIAEGGVEDEDAGGRGVYVGFHAG